MTGVTLPASMSTFIKSKSSMFGRTTRSQGTFTSTNILGKTTQARHDVSEDFITWLKSPDVSASHLNSPGYVGSEYLPTWS
jgi:hypothetical protein